MLATLTIAGAFAKEKNSNVEETAVEVTADEFFNGNYNAQKGTVYKITGVELLINAESRFLICYHDLYRFCDFLSKFVSKEEMSRIKKAEEFESLRTNYIMYAQTNKSNPGFKDLRIIKVDNIPTIDDITAEIKKEKEEKHLAAEEARLSAEREEKQKKKKEYMKALARREGGYDNIPWGTTFDEFCDFYLGAKWEGNEGSLIVYSKEGTTDNSKLFYKFFGGKLVGGETVFSGVDEITANAINHRLLELYGEPNDINRSQENKYEPYYGMRIPYTETHIKTIWNKSSTFRVILDICILNCDTKIGRYNIVDLNQTSFTIHYNNPAMASKIASADMELKKQEETERKAQEEMELRKRMDSLGL